jgi:ankyrin repeat protein
VRLLLQHGADVNAQDKYNTIPLLQAIKRKMYDITRILLAWGAEPNVKNDGGKTPLHLLLEGEFSNDDDIPDLARLLLEHGADVNAQDQTHATPLLLAAERHMDDIARILLERGADPNVKNIRGKTPLHLLLERYFHDHDDINDILVVERLLLERGADVNAQDEDNTTPLYLAYRHRRFEIAQIILDRASTEIYRHRARSYMILEGEYNSIGTMSI